MLRRILLPLLFLPCVLVAQSGVDELKRSADAGQRVFDQRIARVEADTAIYAPEDCEVHPEPVGGMAALHRHGRHGCNVPNVTEACMATRVTVSMIVEPDGSLSNLSAESKCPELKAWAICSIRNAGPWKPGEKDGRRVRVRMTIPIQVHLR